MQRSFGRGISGNRSENDDLREPQKTRMLSAVKASRRRLLLRRTLAACDTRSMRQLSAGTTTIHKPRVSTLLSITARLTSSYGQPLHNRPGLTVQKREILHRSARKCSLKSHGRTKDKCPMKEARTARALEGREKQPGNEHADMLASIEGRRSAPTTHL